MTRDTMKYYAAFFMLLLICGGGCLYMPYIPEQQTDLKVVGLDEHTRARLMGEADPRPNDPQPTIGLGGRLAVVPMNWHGGFGHTADITPSEQTFERLTQLDGIEQAYLARIDLTDEHEAMRLGEEPPTIDFQKKLLELAERSQSDLLLVYTTGHNAKSFDMTLGIGQIFLLGFCPTVVFSAEADTTAILMDPKTGFIYALTTGEGDDGAMGVGWGQAEKKANAASHAAEESFDEVVDRFEEAWPMLRGIYP